MRFKAHSLIKGLIREEHGLVLFILRKNINFQKQ